MASDVLWFCPTLPFGRLSRKPSDQREPQRQTVMLAGAIVTDVLAVMTQQSDAQSAGLEGGGASGGGRGGGIERRPGILDDQRHGIRRGVQADGDLAGRAGWKSMRGDVEDGLFKRDLHRMTYPARQMRRFAVEPGM